VSVAAADVDQILGNGHLLQIYFQPIVDLQRGRTAGYEALARFPSMIPSAVKGVSQPGGPTPDQWFAAADATGRGAQLEALALGRALAARPAMPENTFLSVNVSPHLLATPQVQQALSGDLRGVVVELTEHVRNGDERILLAALDSLRARGALVALDDAGSGYAGLRQVAVVRPSLVKLDRSLVERVDTDPAKLVLARLLGAYSGELDAWLLAEGIETDAELHVFVSLGVPLGQGYLLGRPSPDFEALDPQLAARIAAAAALVRSRHKVASLVSPVATRRLGETSDVRLPRVVLDDTGRPVGLELSHRPSSASGGVMTVHPVDDVASVTARAMSRPEARRWDPLVLTGARGQVLGLVTIDALVLRLAELQQVQDRADTTGPMAAPAIIREPTGHPSTQRPYPPPNTQGVPHEEVRLW
jgi:EAL domain-containing protein (putative c-di-GMP-specific phosphodiesterase class I)